jgi:flagellin
MSRINTNVQSMISQRVLATNNGNLSQSLERLSTGLKINRGKDDPAGLIASQNLTVEQKGISGAITNAERADQVANIAESGLAEVSTMLEELQGAITNTANKAGISDEEKQANQLVVDSILQTIDRVSSSTNFQGIKLLNGNYDYKTSSIASGISDFRIRSAKYSGASMGVDVTVTQSAQQGGMFLSMGGTSLDIGTGSSFVVEISGSKGAREFTFSSGTSLTKIRDAINTFSDVTGVTASLSTASSTSISLKSSDFGSSEFVAVKVIDDGGINTAVSAAGVYKGKAGDVLTKDSSAKTAFTAATNSVIDYGQDIGGTINGLAISGKGKTARVSSDFLDAQITLSDSASRTLGNVGTGSALYVTGGGAEFQFGSKVSIAGAVNMGIQSVASNKLGNSTLGYLNSLASGRSNNVINGDTNAAQKIISESIAQVSQQRGSLGTFQKNTIGSTIRSLNVSLENTAAANSMIKDADFASETAQLTRSQILVSASTNILALSNQAPNSALQLLG